MENVINIVNSGLTDYSKALELQHDIFDKLLTAKEEGKEDGNQVLLLCEHPHVYTLGKSGMEQNLLVDREFLQSIGATYFRTDRGGDITYHGPGQLVGYPILDLDILGLSLKGYIHALEESVIRTVAEYGIRGERFEGAAGVWIDAGSVRARKICAIGVRASRFVTMHGFALNVSTDLDYFSHINPCGFADRGVTSIEKECGYVPAMEDVIGKYVVHFREITNY